MRPERLRLRLGAISCAVATMAASCGSEDAAPGAAAPADEACRPGALAARAEPVEVTLWHTLPALRGGSASAPFADLVETFNRSQAKVRINVRGFSSWEEMERRFFSLAPGDRETPDLTELTWGAHRAAIDTERVIPVQACADATRFDWSDFVPQTLATTKLDDRQWGLPMGHFGHLFLYDKSAFTRAGLDPERPPATLADLRRAADELKAAGVPFPLATQVVHPLFWASTATVNHDDGHSGKATKAVFASDETDHLLRWVKAMYDDRLVRPANPNPPFFDDLLAMGRGESAMTFGLSFDLKDIAKALAQGQAPGFRLGVAPLPTLRGPGAGLANGSSLFVSSGTSQERREAAWSFLEWFSSPAQQARWHESTFFFPTRRAAAAEPAVMSMWAREPILADGWRAATSPTATSGSFVGASRQVGAEFDRALEEIVDRSRPIEAAVEEAEERANRILAAYNADTAGWVRCHYAGAGCK